MGSLLGEWANAVLHRQQLPKCHSWVRYWVFFFCSLKLLFVTMFIHMRIIWIWWKKYAFYNSLKFYGWNSNNSDCFLFFFFLTSRRVIAHAPSCNTMPNYPNLVIYSWLLTPTSTPGRLKRGKQRSKGCLVDIWSGQKGEKILMPWLYMFNFLIMLKVMRCVKVFRQNPQKNTT